MEIGLWAEKFSEKVAKEVARASQHRLALLNHHLEQTYRQSSAPIEN